MIRSSSVVARCCNSNATGPAQPSVSVPDTSRRGIVVLAKAGPTINGQSAISAALAGECFRNAAFVTAGINAPTGLGPDIASRRLVLPAAFRLVLSEAMQSDAPECRTPPAALILDWYDRCRRSMPWRSKPGEVTSPYKVWLSEIMLQQTTVATVVPYFDKFLQRFPTIEALAAAPLDDVLECWAGLGYYARARNLHACARRVVQLGTFPTDLARLRALPGIGVYTASAIASIAFGLPVVPVDGNVERVVARLFGIRSPLPGSRPAIAAASVQLGNQAVAKARASDFTQALFDLGATICTPKRPACSECPWRGFCQAFAAGDHTSLPVKAAKKPRPFRYGAHFWLEDAMGNILLTRRPPTGLLGGMLELPGTPWRDSVWSEEEALAAAPQTAPWRHVGVTQHGFTHFQLNLHLYAATVVRIVGEGLLLPIPSLGAAALPSVMARCAALVLSQSRR